MIYVVPSLKAKEKLQAEGRRWAESQGFTWQARQKRTVQDLMAEYGENFLVYSSRGPQIDRPEGCHFFSLNMAELRIQNLRKGQPDHLLEALMGVKTPSAVRRPQTVKNPSTASGPPPLRWGGFRLPCEGELSAQLTEGFFRRAAGFRQRCHHSEFVAAQQHLSPRRTADGGLRTAAAQPPISLLDCTCGFGADTAVASFGLPPGSRVDALEVSPLLAAVTGWGFSHFIHKKDDVTAALRRITLRCGDYRDYLYSDGGPEYDVLYFDPMFQRPVEASCQFQPVRAIMEHAGLKKALIERALLKARRRVVIKERDFRWLRRDFPDAVFYGGKYSRIGYAVLECDSWKK